MNSKKVNYKIISSNFPKEMEYSISGLFNQASMIKGKNYETITRTFFDLLKSTFPNYIFQVFYVERKGDYNFCGEMNYNCAIKLGKSAFVVFATSNEDEK